MNDTAMIRTFGEYHKKWSAGATMLIAPHDVDTRDHNEFGIIDGRHWRPLSFSPALQDLTGTFVRSQILEYCSERSIKLTEEQIVSTVEIVQYWLTDAISNSIDNAIDNLELDRELVILNAWGGKNEGGDLELLTTDVSEIPNGTCELEIVKGFIVSGGADIRDWVEDNLKEFYEDKDELNAALVEHNLTHLVNDQSEGA
ncbi:hypothetical protein GZH47_33470 (plasmid) [Paenibacillus rhizovicinus]|uniref:Uncharacterized protein n=1 Tax=Paenibacillus rhizovicinus TaxID=2704463 RepID=A0A6C0PB53_9BACL|nr:hypothetical protein [Paenibacillus rhizovicinus]QHW35804.1 hypothetical protein GZH47_33470 [Paenibacillus rhizovicinus]